MVRNDASDEVDSRVRDYHSDGWLQREEMIRNVSVFDSNEITYVDNHREIMKALYRVNKDVTTRFVYRELGQSNISRRLLEERYHRPLMRKTDVYYSESVQPYNIVTYQSGELSRLSL